MIPTYPDEIDAETELSHLRSALAASDLDRIRLRDGLRTALAGWRCERENEGRDEHPQIAKLEKLLGGGA